MSRAELVERYRALPLPTTSEEPWRFTDLRGFDPDAFKAGQTLDTSSRATSEGQTRDAAAPAMLEMDIGGLVTVNESSLEIERAPEGITFERLWGHPRLHAFVGGGGKVHE